MVDFRQRGCHYPQPGGAVEVGAAAGVESESGAAAFDSPYPRGMRVSTMMGSMPRMFLGGKPADSFLGLRRW